MQVMAMQGDTVDAICYRYYGQTQGMVEQVLESNQNLASIGIVLPIGTVVNLPDVAPKKQNNMIQLWD